MIMRSLGMSPTITELKKYFSDNSKYKILNKCKIQYYI